MATNDPPSFPYDEQNPYAPPRADVGPEPIFAEMTPMPFTIGDVLSRTWEIYRDRMGICIGVVFGCWALNVGVNLGLQVAQGAVAAVAPQARNPQAIVVVVAVLAFLANLGFQLWLNIGQLLVMVDIAQGRDGVFGDVFTGGRFLLRILLASIVFYLMFMGPLIVGGIPGGVVLGAAGTQSPAGWVVLVLGLLTGVVASIIVALRFSQYYYLIINRDADVIDSLRISYEITRGYAGTIFVLGLLAGAINLCGLLACFIGLIFTGPFTVLLFTITYLALTGQPTADPNSKGEPLAELEPL